MMKHLILVLKPSMTNSKISLGANSNKCVMSLSKTSKKNWKTRNLTWTPSCPKLAPVTTPSRRLSISTMPAQMQWLRPSSTHKEEEEGHQSPTLPVRWVQAWLDHWANQWALSKKAIQMEPHMAFCHLISKLLDHQMTPWHTRNRKKMMMLIHSNRQDLSDRRNSQISTNWPTCSSKKSMWLKKKMTLTA